MPGDDEPTAALTSRTAVIATLLLFGAIVVFVALTALLPEDDPDSTEAATAPPVVTDTITEGAPTP